MVAKIKSGKSLTGALNYNENKVKAGKAELIGTNGYVKSHETLSFYDKLFRLTDLAERNLRTKTNTVHLSLNFDINENIDNELLVNIAGGYMNRIGFGRQPYLIYKHFDAGHPHMHIVTTNIQADGVRISLHHIGERLSEPARKAVEVEFGLVRAGDHLKVQSLDQHTSIQPLEYGATDTRRAISNIVNAVTKNYKFTSLPEFNAILNQFNILADRGNQGSVMFKQSGLRYWATDKSGRKTGVPIKASSICHKPTLKLLEDRFKLNEYLRKPFREKLKVKVDKAKVRATSLQEFINDLKQGQVTVLVRQNADGRIYGLSYIDHADKVVFNGSDLGKGYSAAAVIDALQFKVKSNGAASAERAFGDGRQVLGAEPPVLSHAPGRSLLEELLSPYEANQETPGEFGPKKKKKKRRRLNL